MIYKFIAMLFVLFIICGCNDGIQAVCKDKAGKVVLDEVIYSYHCPLFADNFIVIKTIDGDRVVLVGHSCFFKGVDK